MSTIQNVKKMTNTVVKKRTNKEVKSQREEVAEEEEALVEEVAETIEVETTGIAVTVTMEITEAQEKSQRMAMMEATLDRNMPTRVVQDEIKKTKIRRTIPIRNLPEEEVKDLGEEASRKQPFHLLMKISPHYDEGYWF